MTEGLTLVIVTGLLWSVIGIICSTAARGRLDFLALMATATALNATFAWLLLADHRALTAGEVAGAGRLATVMIAAGLLSCAGMLLMQRAMRMGHHGMTWTVGQSALILPFLAGWLVFGEPAKSSRLAGVSCILVSLVLFGSVRTRAQDEAEPTSRWWLPAALLVLLLLGLQQTLTTLPSHWHGWRDTARLRVPLYNSGQLAAYGGILLVRRRRPTWGTVKLGVLLSAISLTSLWLLYRGLDRLAAAEAVSVAYPAAVGACIAGFAFYSRLVLRERSGPRHLTGLVLALLGIALIGL